MARVSGCFFLDDPSDGVSARVLEDSGVRLEVGGSVDATAFFYQPATEGLIDITEMQVQGLGLMR